MKRNMPNQTKYIETKTKTKQIAKPRKNEIKLNKIKSKVIDK